VPDRSALRADCAACTGLCCVAPAFSRSSDFAADKPAGLPCRHLGADARCGIHPVLRERGYTGCAVFDCFGAGQRVTAAAGSWREPGAAPAVFAAFAAVRPLHEVLWYLADALDRPAAAALRDELRSARDATERLVEEALAAPVDVDAHRGAVAPLLRRVSALVRDPAGAALEGADLTGRDLRRTDLRRAGLRGALLLGADLRGRDLTDADLLGADLRGADVRGADLRGALFLTRFQVAATGGDGATRLPAVLPRPEHWSPAGGP
jgi:hypothetical protein